MSPGKGCLALLAIVLLHLSVALVQDSTTDDLIHLQHRQQDVYPSAEDQLNSHLEPVQVRSDEEQISIGEDQISTLEHFYMEGDLSKMKGRPHDKFLSAFVKNDLDDSKVEDNKKYIVRKIDPVNEQGNGNNIHNYTGAKSESVIMKEQGVMNEDLFLKVLGSQNESSFLHEDGRPQLQGVGDVLKNGGWAMVKSTVLKAVNTIPHYDESSILENVKQLLDIGDKMNYVQSFVGKLEPSLSAFLYDHVRKPIVYLTDLLKYIGLFTNDIDAWNNVERLMASKIVKVLVTKAQNLLKNNLSLNGLKKYYTILQETNPLAAQALDFVLNLFPDAPHEVMGRNFYSEDMFNSYDRGDSKVDRHDDHYGGYGSHDSGYGHDMYHSSYQKVDPYLLLAGLGAATLLSYIAYLVLTTTAPARRKRKRSLNSPSDEDLTDLPQVLYSVNNMIEAAEEKYGQELELMDDLSNTLNSLWNTQKEEGCVKCVLQDSVKRGLERPSFKHLVMSGAAQLMGATRVGPLLDELMAPVPSHLVDKTQNKNDEEMHGSDGPSDEPPARHLEGP